MPIHLRRFDPGSRSGAGCETARFDEPEYGVSPGQAAVLYGDRLLGGGWIEETIPAELEVV
jgi:tRNA-specific 2-thiouridylase